MPEVQGIPSAGVGVHYRVVLDMHLPAMKLWLDDIRPAPDTFVWAKTAEEAIAYLATGDVTLCSLDHDLAEEHGMTGYDVLAWMEECVAKGIWYGPIPTILVHSANPPARKRMQMAAMAIRARWDRRDPDGDY